MVSYFEQSQITMELVTLIYIGEVYSDCYTILIVTTTISILYTTLGELLPLVQELFLNCCGPQLIDEEKISAQVQVASPGPVDFQLSEIIPNCIEYVKLLGGLTIGVLAVTKPEAIPTLLKNLFSLPAEVSREYVASERAKLQLEQEKKHAPLETEAKELDNLEKKLAILEKLKALGADPQTIEKATTELSGTFPYLQITSAENRLPAAALNNNGNPDEKLEGEIAEEETAD